MIKNYLKSNLKPINLKKTKKKTGDENQFIKK